MRKLLSKIVSRMRGEEFLLDRNVPVSYCIFLLLRKFGEMTFGLVYLRRCRIVLVHPSSRIRCKKKFRFGKGLRVDRRCYIDALSTGGITLGDNVSIGKSTTIECSGTLTDLGKGLLVGDRVGLGTHGFLGCAGGIEIGDDTIFGNYVSLHAENHNFEQAGVPIRLQGVSRKGIKIGRNCWIGAKATILDGAVIGDGCVVAAGAVVRGVIPPDSVVGGVPAKVIKNRITG
ncbi:acyltransferase [uncultured Alistipes sp.]|uniref:acyltransferase n=1 Tax=uncultured Alistipes sp. TaxID=538949 RepID=UPI0025DA28F7|nr:acyltransferase [uncultured Alistipes sp.]